jgi:hypothetical protein
VGDMALRDENGFIKLIDRKKKMIISGGENIYPTEVEAVLGNQPAIEPLRGGGEGDDVAAVFLRVQTLLLSGILSDRIHCSDRHFFLHDSTCDISNMQSSLLLLQIVF